MVIKARMAPPVDRISDVLAPTLIVAGENDRRTRISESKLLHSLAPEPKEFFVVPDASHNDFHRHAKAAYESRVLGFLHKHMNKADSQILHPAKINPIF